MKLDFEGRDVVVTGATGELGEAVAGLLLEAGATDPQSPHTEDELYVVMSGRAMVTVGEEDRPIRAGSVIFVAAGVDHRFHDIDERLVLLVMFGPAEYSRRSP